MNKAIAYFAMTMTAFSALKAQALTDAEIKICAKADLLEISAETDGQKLFKLGASTVGQLLSWNSAELDATASEADKTELEKIKNRIQAAKTCSQGAAISQELFESEQELLLNKIVNDEGLSLEETYNYVIMIPESSISTKLMKSVQDDLVALGATQVAQTLKYKHHEIRANILSTYRAFKQLNKKVTANDVFEGTFKPEMNADELELALVDKHRLNLSESVLNAIK